MKSLDEFKQFYREELQENVKKLRKDNPNIFTRLEIKDFLKIDLSTLIIAAILFMIFGIPIVGLLWISKGSFPFFWTIIGVLTSHIVSRGILQNNFQEKAQFKTAFKQQIMGSIIRFLGNQFSYNPTEGLAKEKLNDSFILPRKAKGVKSEDYVSGTVGDTDISFCEIIASASMVEERKVYQISNEQKGFQKMSRSMLAKMRHEISEFYRGIYFVADFHKSFQANVLIRPTEFTWNDHHNEETAEPYKVNKRLDDSFEQVHLEDPVLESTYNFYSTDQQEARYILSTTMMERIKQFSNRTNKKLFFCFKNSSMHLTIPYKKDLFDPDILSESLRQEPDLSNILNNEEIFTYFQDINFLLGIVEDFNLNTRIWSKT